MTIAEIIAAISAAEQLIPSFIALVNAIHPPTTGAPTKAAAVLATTSAALQVAGITAETVQALQPTFTAATDSALGVTTVAVASEPAPAVSAAS